MRSLFALSILSLLLSSCVMKKKEQVQPLDTSSLMHHVKVEEVLQATSYTYLHVSENSEDYWMAVTKMDAKAGDSYYYDGALEMANFKSKDLDRVFDRILFVDKISNKPIEKSGTEMPHPMMGGMESHTGRKAVAEAENVHVGPVAGGITIAELYKNSAVYSEKQVIIRGQVVKVNNSIMGRNWVHLQDGTKDGDNFDLTFMTNDVVNVGDVVTFEGTVALNKDFGAGYVYDLIVENSSLKK